MVGYNRTDIIYFNSQPHEEADKCGGCVRCQSRISTHSLTRRLTIMTDEKAHCIKHFNSQPHEEADGYWPYVMIFDKQFQLTASRGG